MTGYSQNFPVARHFWLNDSSYNHTLALTSDGGYILAAARQEQGAKTRNTVAVFKLDNTYDIRHPQTPLLPNAQIIGIPVSADEKGIVNFEVHDIIENAIMGDEGEVISYYVICGSMRRYAVSDEGHECTCEKKCECPPDRECTCEWKCTCGGGLTPLTAEAGMVIVIDANLNVLSIREYPSAKTFYSVYAKDNYFYVCGKTPNTATAPSNGIFLRDELFTMNPTAYITNQPWEYHKVKLNTNGTDLLVSGTDYNEIGFTAFDIAGGNFAPIANASRKFPISQPLQINSKVVVTNDPNNPQGLILSAMVGFEIHTYLFNTYLSPANTCVAITRLPYYPPSICVLEDVNTVQATPTYPNGRIAWVGNVKNIPDARAAFYISTTLSFTQQPKCIIFHPFPTHPATHYRLHKVHYNDTTFHCGGFYSHESSNKTTFVVAPEAVSNISCHTNEMPLDFPANLPLPRIIVFPVTSMNVSVKPNPWFETRYNFCDTNCDDTPLNNNLNNNSCGNQP